MEKTGESWQSAQRHVRAKAAKNIPKMVAYPNTTCWDCDEEWEHRGPKGLKTIACPLCGAPNVPGGYKQRQSLNDLIEKIRIPFKVTEVPATKEYFENLSDLMEAENKRLDEEG